MKHQYTLKPSSVAETSQNTFLMLSIFPMAHQQFYLFFYFFIFFSKRYAFWAPRFQTKLILHLNQCAHDNLFGVVLFLFCLAFFFFVLGTFLIKCQIQPGIGNTVNDSYLRKNCQLVSSPVKLPSALQRLVWAMGSPFGNVLFCIQLSNIQHGARKQDYLPFALGF